MENNKWIWLIGLLAYYLYSAYAANKKKQEESNKKQQPPKRHFNPTPSSGDLPKSVREIFKEFLPEETSPKPKTNPKTEPKLKAKPIVAAPVNWGGKQPTVHTAVFTEGQSVFSPEQAKTSVKSDDVTVATRESYQFNAREAFIGSVIFNRPDY